MSTIARVVIGLAVFVAFYVILTFFVAPRLTQQGGSAALEAALARFPVLVLRHESDGKSPSFAVARMGSLESITAKATSYTFLLPAGRNEVVDQDGDPASYTAETISSGRQRITLRAMVGDYTHDVQYEAEDKKVFPLQVQTTGPQVGIITIPVSALLAWLVLWLTGRRDKTELPQ